MVKKIYGLLLMVICTLPVFSQNKDAVLGKWLNSNGEAQILIYKSGKEYNGKLVWLKDIKDKEGKVKVDTKNPKAVLQKRPLLGLELLKGFNYMEDGTWQDGTIYDPKTGKTYSCKLSLTNNDKLNIRGYVGISLLGRTEIWTRIK